MLPTKLLVPFIIAFLILPLSSAGQSSSPSLPNIIIIFTDDQGYNDLGCFGSPNIKTPHIDQMAEEGMRFTDFYSTAAICSAARASLLTGSYAPRNQLTGVFWPRGSKNDTRKGIHENEITMAELLKTKDYKTACLGKWHLGDYEMFLPTMHGFDYFYGIPYSNDMDDSTIRNEPPLPLMRNLEVIEQPTDNSLLTQKITEEALRYIEDNKDHPFFLYLPHPAPHDPPGASEDFAGKSEAGVYGDAVEELDWSTGLILDKLKELGIEENTFVVFTSDNGPWLDETKEGGSAFPLKGGKFDADEGGVRMPCVMWWPGTIPAGAVCSEVATTMDFFVTFAEYANIPIPDDRVIDGKNILPLMTGMEGATSPYEYMLYFGRDDNASRIRHKDWKYTLGDPGILIDLSMDISEENDMAGQYPELCQELKQKINDANKEIRDYMRPVGEYFIGVESIEMLNCPDEPLEVGDMLRLHHRLLPIDAKDKTLTMISSDSSVVTFAGILIKAQGPGTATITSISNSGGHETTCDITVIPSTVGIHDSKDDVSIVRIYPNPAGNSAKIQIIPSHTGIVTLKLLDVQGGVYYDRQFNCVAGLQFEKVLSFESLNPGIYFATVDSGSHSVQTLKILHIK